jgi:hypothetical protein
MHDEFGSSKVSGRSTLEDIVKQPLIKKINNE